MPYKNPEAKKAHSKKYYAKYREEHGAEIAERQAEWYQENKPVIVAKQRLQRRVQRAVEGMGVLQNISSTLNS